MKKGTEVLALLVLIGTFIFTACDNEKLLTSNPKENNTSSEIFLKSLEPEVVIKGTRDKKDYERVIVQELVKSDECRGEVVSGIVEFYYKGEMVFSVNFGNGECDRKATVTWLDNSGTTNSKEVDVWRLFVNKDKDSNDKKCFKFVYPITYKMPDGSAITIESREDWTAIKSWYEANPDSKERPELHFPVDVTFRDGTTITVENAEKMRGVLVRCNDSKRDGKDRDDKKCFKFVYPITYTMPYGSAITVESREDWTVIKSWYEANPDSKERPELHFPVDITFRDGTTITVENAEKMRRILDRCNDSKDKP